MGTRLKVHNNKQKGSKLFCLIPEQTYLSNQSQYQLILFWIQP